MTRNTSIEKALKENLFFHRYAIAANHAFLWIAALSLAAFAHLSPLLNHDRALLASTLVAYCAYLCESGLGRWRVACSKSMLIINFRKASYARWILLNLLCNVALSVIFLFHPSIIWIIAIIAVAGWQKYMDGRIPPSLLDNSIPLTGNTFTAQ